MKKLVCVLLILILCIGAMFALTACDKSASVGDAIDFGAKYVYKPITSNYTSTYTFYKDGTGAYTYYERSTSRVFHYSINFKYEYIDSDKSTVVAFYDSVTYHDDHTASTDSDLSTWKDMLTVSKVMLVSYKEITYSNEEYIKNKYPNFKLN